MLKVTTPLLVLASELVTKAIAGLQSGALDADDAQMLSRRATALNRVVDLATRHGLADILSCEDLDELARYAEDYRSRFPDLARAIARSLAVSERSSS